MHPTGRHGTLIAAALILLAGCGSAPATPLPPASQASSVSSPVASAAAFQPTYAATPCPDDVTSQVVIQVTCGFLTVLENRSKPAGRTIRLFVARFDPPGGTTTVDPVVTLGHLAVRDGYGDMSGGGQRTHRVLYLVDPRGIGHSSPSLDCPEIPLVGPDAAGLRLRDPARRTLLLGAVAACHDRLVGQGIDLAAYGVADHAADLEDLRIALKIPLWNLMTNGDASRVAFEVSSRYPKGLRSLIIDSPSLPTPNFLTVGPEATDSAISGVVSACSAEPACVRAYPDAAAMIRNAISKLDATPVTIDVSGTVDAIRLGHPIRVVVDGAALLRVIRANIGSAGGSADGAVLALAQHVIDGKLGQNEAGVVALSADVGDCLGLLTSCEQPNLGVLYSIVCSSIAPAIDQTRLLAGVSGRPAYADVFAPSPMSAPCDTWGVTAPATGPSPGSLTGGVPTLVMRGALDPFSAPLADVRAATANAPDVFTLDVPNQSYNVLGYTECPRAIRNAWIDSPTSPPDAGCLSSIPAPGLAP